MPRPVSSTYVEDKVRQKQEQEEQAMKDEPSSRTAQQPPQPPQQYEYPPAPHPGHAPHGPPPPHGYPPMAYAPADPQQQQQQYAAAQQAEVQAQAAGGYFVSPSEYAALQQLRAQQAQAAAAQAQGQGQGHQPPIDRTDSYEQRSSPALSAAAAAHHAAAAAAHHHHHHHAAAAAAAAGAYPPPAIGPSSSFGGAPAAYYPHQHPHVAASMSRSFSGGSSGEMHQQQPPQPQATVPDGYPGAYPEHYPQHPHHSQYVAGPPPQYVAGPPGAYPGQQPYGVMPPGVAASASGGASSDHGGSDAGSMTSSSHQSSYHQQTQQQRPPVPPATRRSARRGSKSESTGDDTAPEQGSASTANTNNSKTFKEPDNAVIEDSKPVYGDPPLIRHLKKTNANLKDLRTMAEQGIVVPGSENSKDEGDLADPPALEVSKSWKATSSWEQKQSAVPIEMTDQTICCTCKKSKCLKLYCQCFASKAMCGPACRCMMCHNNPNQEKERTEAIRLILQRNPSAFEDKFAKTSGSGKKGENAKGHKIGCKCRKSACLKKYCECYHAGVKCSSNCRCTDCKNTPDGSINNPTAGSSMAVSMNPNAAYAQSRRMDYLPEMVPGHGHAPPAPAYRVPVVTNDPAAAMAPGAYAASVRKSTTQQSPGRIRTARKFAVASDFPTTDTPSKGTGKPKASPGDPRAMEDAAFNLAFLKGASPARKEKKMAHIPDISAMPSLTSSEEVYESHTGAALATSADAFVEAKSVSDVISPNSERKASNAVDLLLAASALTDLTGSTGAKPPASPPKLGKKEVIGLSDGPETPQRYARQSSSSSIARASPKRKSSFGSDCPTLKRQSSFGSQDAAMHSPDARANQRKNIRDIETAISTDAAMLLVGSHSGEGDQDSAAGGPAVMPPYTPPIPPKTKKTRMGTVKRNGARNVPPNPPTDPNAFDSAARPSKSLSDGEEDGSSQGSPGSNGDSSDNQEDSNTAGVFRDRAATPPGRDPSDVLTPVSSRIVGLRQLHVNDSTDGGVVTGESIGMDLEDEVKVGKI